MVTLVFHLKECGNNISTHLLTILALTAKGSEGPPMLNDLMHYHMCNG